MVSVKRVFGPLSLENQIWNSFTFLHGYQCPSGKKNGRRLERIPSGSKNEKPPRKMVLIVASIENSFLEPTSFSCVK